ncbi:MAG: tetratricopeptide repeat protein [Candidatus Acidiferrales bacterium]
MQPNKANPVRLILVAAALCLAVAACLAEASHAQRGGRDRNDSLAEAGLQKGIALTRSGKFQEAIPHFLAARGQVRDEYAVTFNLALCYLATGQYPRSIELLNELRSRGRANADVENLLAQSLLGNGQPEEAFAAVERAARLRPKNEKLYLFISEACMDSGYHEIGLRVAEMGLKHLPRSARLVFERAMLLAKLDRLDEAKQDLEKVTTLDPGSDVAYIAAAQKHLFEGNVRDAVSVAREGIRKGKQHTMLLALYGEAVMQFGMEPGDEQFAEARAALERAVAERPSYASAQIALGKLYLMEGRLDDSVAHLNAARQLDPQNPAVYSNLATAFRRQGNVAQAEEMLAILARINQEQVERIRSAPGDRKPGYAAKPPSQ